MRAVRMPSPIAAERPLARALPVAALVAAAGFWLWLALCVHTMTVVGGEIDHYVERAEVLLRGNLTTDRLHPMGLSLLIAALGWLGVEPFVGGRLIGVASALVLVSCTFFVVRGWAARLPATLAAIAVGASPFVLYCAVQAASDVPAAACLSMALVGFTRAAREHRSPATRLVLAGLALGFAGSLRMPSLAFAPAFLPLCFGVAWRERARRVGFTALGGAIGLAPHLVTLYLTTGKLFQNTTQIVWKYRFLNDYDAFLAYLDAPTPVSWQELSGWLRIGFGDWFGYLGSGIGWPWSLDVGFVAVVVSVWFAVALLLPFVLRRRDAAVLAIGAWSYSLLLCVLSVPLDRLTIPMAMPAVALATLAWAPLPPRLRALPACVAFALAATAVGRMPTTLAYFERLHARAEMAVARGLIAEHGEWITVAMPAVGLQRGLPCFIECFVPTEDVDMPSPTYWDRLLANPESAAARFVVVGRGTWPAIHAELSASPPPPGYRSVQRGDVLVFERQDATGWCANAAAERVGDELHLSLRLTDGVDRSRLAGAGFLVRAGGTGDWQPLLLAPAADGGFAKVLVCDPAAANVLWSFVPATLSWDGSKRTARAIEVEAPGRTIGSR